jgi:hypothetical protein
MLTGLMGRDLHTGAGISQKYMSVVLSGAAEWKKLKVISSEGTLPVMEMLQEDAPIVGCLQGSLEST